MKNKVLLFYFENTLVDYKDHFGRYFEEVVKHRKNSCSKNILLKIYTGCDRLKYFILKINYEIVKTHFKFKKKNCYLPNVLTCVSSNH